MAQQAIDIGTVANDRTGDTWRDAFDKTNDNFDEVYAALAVADHSGLLSMAGNSTASTIATINTPVLVAGTWVVGSTSLFTGTTAGRLTYTGTGGAVTINAVVDIEPASGTAKELTTYIAINGTVVASSGRKVTADSGLALNVALLWQVMMATNDYVELYVENNTDAIDALVSGAVLVV